MTIKAEASPGQDILSACQEALKIANATTADVKFKFNDVEVIMEPGASVSEAEAMYLEKAKGSDTYKFRFSERYSR